MTSSTFLRIFRRNRDGSLTGETTDGQLHPLAGFVEDEELVPGDILRIFGSDWELVDAENWVPHYKVGRVLAAGPERVVVDVEGRVVDAANACGQPLSQGNTVRLDARSSITELISEEPLYSAPIQIGKDDDFDPVRLIEDTSGSALEWVDFGGMPDLVEHAREIVEVHLEQRDAYTTLGATPLRGAVFEGPPGTGKTLLARIMAHKAAATLYIVGAAELGGRLVGESEGRLQAVYDHAAENTLSIIFIDELDSITHQRGESQTSHADRLVSTFLVNMDGFKAKNNVITIGTTNRIEDIDKALRRPGRFGTELTFRSPTLPDRVSILAARARTMRTVGDLPHGLVASETEGWSPAELDEIWTKAATEAIRAGSQAITEVHYVVGFEQALAQHPQRSTERSRL